MKHGEKTLERKEAIRGAYRMTGESSFYDGMITCSTLSGKAVCRLVWAMNKAENNAYLEKALSGIPEHFSGRLLEVPVGTGVLTMPLYQTLPEADITCLDYSPDMMSQAQEKANRLKLNNVTFRQGDVGALPYYEFTSCPAAEFAIKHGLTDIMPALCNVDFASMELLHARLVRTTTCVDGCKCDYAIYGDKDPYLKEHPEYRDEAGYRRNK